MTGMLTEGGTAPLVFNNLLAAAYDRSLHGEPFRPGIEAAWLYRTPHGSRAAFLRYAPGARLVRHEHLGYEHIFVLGGSQTDDAGVHRAGALLVHPPGSRHAIVSDGGSVVLAVWEKPVMFRADVEAAGVDEGSPTE